MAAQTTTMTVRVPVQVKRRLERLAKATARTASWLAADALAAYVDLHDWQVAAIEEGIADAEAGRVVDDERVEAWLASWGTRGKRRAPGRASGPGPRPAVSRPTRASSGDATPGRAGKCPPGSRA